MRRAWPLSVSRGRSPALVRPGVGRLRAAADDSRSQHVAAGRRGQGHCRFAGSSARSPTARRCGRRPATARGSWPSFRGPQASGIAEKQRLPDTWNVKTGENILWRTPIPGLAHSSPIVWGDRMFVTTRDQQPAERDLPARTVRRRRRLGRSIAPALDDLRDRQAHGKDSVGARGPRGRAASTSGTSSRPTRARLPPPTAAIVVAWFGSQGVYAYDLDGKLRWKVDLGRVDMGAYDIPTFEWGPASSPIIWNGLVILQCRHAGRFVRARARTSTRARPCGRPNARSCRRGARRRWR